MKKALGLLAATLASLTIGLTSTAAKADGTERTQRAPAAGSGCAASKFAGFYGGLNLGTATYSSQIALDDLIGLTTRHDDNNSFTIGGQVGYNLVRCSTLFGVETDINWTDTKSDWGINLGGVLPGAPSIFSAKSEMNYLGTLRTRGGVVLDDTLLYVTGGLAYSEIKHSGSSPPVYGPGSPAVAFGSSDVRWGWVVGGGVEHKISDRISLKSEALYARFDDKAINFNLAPLAPSSNLALRSHDEVWTLRFGVNVFLNGDRGIAAEPLK